MKLLLTMTLLFFTTFVNAGPLERAKLHLENQVKDPSSLIIDTTEIVYFTDQLEIEAVPSEKAYVCGIYNAKNGYGAYAGRTGFVILIRPDKTLTMSTELNYTALKKIFDARKPDNTSGPGLGKLLECMEALDKKGYPISQFFD